MSTAAIGGNRQEKTISKPKPRIDRWPDEFSVDVSVPASAAIGLREGFGRGASLDWSGPLVAEKELRAEVDVTWYAKLLAKISSLLRRPAVRVGS